MTVASQQITTSFTPPPAAACSLYADSANAKVRVSAYLVPPAAGAPAVSTVNFLRSVTLKNTWAAIVGSPNLPLTLTTATITGFNAYRQIPAIPDVGVTHGWNLPKNAGFTATVGAEWALNANAAVVTDARFSSGKALRTIATSGSDASQQADFPIEPGKPYGAACELAGDGSTGCYYRLSWLDASGSVISSIDSATVSAAAVSDTKLTNQVAPGNARKLRLIAIPTAAGIVFHSGFRVKQQTTAPLAWSAADQQMLGNQGIVVYEGTTNATPADADMEAVGVASWNPTGATVTKDATTKFSGTQSLKIVGTGAGNTYAETVGAVAVVAGQVWTVSVRLKGGGAAVAFPGGAALRVYTQPSNTAVVSAVGPAADWQVRSATITIPAGDTSLKAQLFSDGATGVVAANFDQLAIEQKPYNTLNSGDGQEFTTGTRAASSDTETLDSGFNIADFGRTVALRLDHAANGHAGVNRRLWTYYIDANNYIYVEQNAGGAVVFRKVRAGVGSQADDASATSAAAGDMVVVGVRHSAAVGLEMTVYKNGTLVGTYTQASAEAKTPLAGTPTNYMGTTATTGNELDGTFGVDRHLNAGVTAAQVTTSVQNPYADPQDYEAAVYVFSGQAYQVPVFDDHLVNLSNAFVTNTFDWRADTSSAGANATTAQGQATTGSLTAAADSWWIKDVQTPANNVKLPVLNEFPYKVHRPAQVLSPLAPSSQAEVVIYGPSTYGARSTLKFKYSTGADQNAKVAALRTLLASNDDLYLVDVFGGVRKIKFPSGIDVSLHEYLTDGSLSFVEVV